MVSFVVTTFLALVFFFSAKNNAIILILVFSVVSSFKQVKFLEGGLIFLTVLVLFLMFSVLISIFLWV